MWFLISRRLRAWLLLSIGLPLLRVLLGWLTRQSARRSPHGSVTRLLQRLDGALGSVRRRRTRKA